MASSGMNNTDGANVKQLEGKFQEYCKMQDKGKGMEGKNMVKICKDTKLIAQKDSKLTTTDVDIMFKKIAGNEKVIYFEQFMKVLNLVASKKFAGDDRAFQKTCEQICKGNGPSLNKTTKALKIGAVDRLTDTTKYTGLHKERFDEYGKGRGLEGRYHLGGNDGYVASYKGKGSYDKTH